MRYPYTVCVDAMRSVAGQGGCLPSRSQMAAVRQHIAEAIGMSDAELARRIADHEIATGGCYSRDPAVLAAQKKALEGEA